MNTDPATPAASSLVSRTITNRLNHERVRIARDAQDIADAAAKIAHDPDTALSTGVPAQLAQEVQQLLARAARYTATRETADLYEVAAQPVPETP